MYTNGTKGLAAAPLAAVLPQTGNAIGSIVSIIIGVLLVVLAITLIIIEIKKRS